MALVLEEARHRCLEIAQEAGDILLQWQDKLEADKIGRKSSSRDLVTQADLASEAIVLQRLREFFPEDGVYAEESGVHQPEAEAVWYVDPLDGTVNFVHGLPQWAVSMARVRNGQPELAVVHVPKLGETYHAALDQGAYLGDQKLQVSATHELDQALLATGFPYQRQTLLDNNLENFNRLFLLARDCRRIGAAAVDLAYVAAGQLDAFWELHLGPYDVAAGALLIREAGGVVDTIVPGGDWLHGANILAGPAALVAAVREVLTAGRDRDYPPLGHRPQPSAGSNS
ncbi:MAG: inositol monophosphatase [Planctomycetota bacterium]|nr:MAG: inositol monophosphatase [Planctomycetota bacterium]